MGYLVKLEVFEGPFVLLLHLIEDAQIDIMDIPIAEITESYLEHLRKMQDLDLVVSGDFLVMAATLLQIKARMLLPKQVKTCADGNQEIDEDPRDELVLKLLEYKFYKEVASRLQVQSEEATTVYPRAYPESLDQKQPIYDNCVGDVEVDVLAKLFQQVLIALEESEKVTYIKRPINLEETLARVRLTLLKQKQVSFQELLVNNDRSYIVYTFLAVLELVRICEIKAVQKEEFGEIYLMAREAEGV